MFSKLQSTLIGLFLVAGSACASAAGFQFTSAPDPQGSDLAVAVWYPSKTAAAVMTYGPTTQFVAQNAAIDGQSLPLVVISHGTGSWSLGHFDTAIALADAGFVVAAVTHTGDNYADHSRSLEIMERPRHISRVIDYMLSGWSGHDRIDPARIGMFGFSAGGFTALVNIGGIPDFSTVAPMCQEHPADYACQLLAKSGHGPVHHDAALAGGKDPRIKAAVVAAPALGFAFAGDGLRNVSVPVQLWRAEDDTIVPHPRYAEVVRLALPQAPLYHVVPRAGHFDFLAPCSDALAAIAPEICTSEPGFDRIEFHRAFDSAIVEFFRQSLNR